MTVTFQDCQPARLWGDIFNNYGGGGSQSPTGQGSATGTSTGTGISLGGLTTGTTVAQDLANVDLLIIALGINDGGVTLGTHGDPTTAATEYGYIRRGIEGVLAANPAMRLVVCSPYGGVPTHPTPTQLIAIRQAILDVCNDNGVPMLDLNALLGFNTFNASIMFRDGLHPSDPLGMDRYGYTIARQLMTLA
jgi:lysophospholipase L1-like esterase